MKTAKFIWFLSAASAAILPAPALAQDSNSSTEAVIVTGSRLAQKGFEMPTPVTAITAKEIQAKAPTTVVDLVRDLPELRPRQNITGSTDSGLATFDLRGLGTLRTLVLVDGKRVLNTSPTSGFDINTLPAPLVQRIEVVTAGASSVYGSDAVSGVVNVFLNNKLEGLRFSADYGFTQQLDNQGVTLNGAWGSYFAGGKGHIMIGASFNRKPDQVLTSARGWGDPNWILVNNTAGQFPKQLQLPGAQLAQMTYGGTITSAINAAGKSVSAGPLNLIRFGANGAQSILNQGQFVTGVYSVNGNGDSPMTKNAVLGPRAERDNLFARASYDFGDDLDGYVEAAYSRSRGQTFNSPNYNAPTAPLLTIGVNNAFLPANIKAAMVANGFSQIVMARLNQEMGNDDNITSFFYYRTAAGLSGKLGAWSWDSSVSYSKVIQSSVVLNNRNEANWAKARDSVIGPSGQPICTSTLTNPGDGCVPVNVFGIDAISPAASKYITGTGWRHVDSTGWDLQGNLTGTLFHNWAGPISVAMGAEYRDEGVSSTVDPVSAVLGYRQTTTLPFSGALTVAEGYVESSIPLLVDVPYAQDVHLDLAGRAVSYSTSGWADVWKSGLWWGINDSIKIRANYSRDFRAPTLNELFATGTQTSGVAVFDREHGNASLVILSLSGGNPFLKPEKATTKTLGVVLTPSFIPGLQLSVDYYNIAMKDAITGVSVQNTEDRCFQGLTDYCKFITRDPVSGLISKVQTTSFNAQALKTDGFDFETQYSFGWDMFDADGSVTVSAVATYIDHLSTITNGVSVDSAGQIFGGTPHWRGTLTSTYRGGPWTIRGAMRFVGGGKYNNNFVQGVDINRNNYPAFVYLDTTVSYDITDKIQVYGKIENLMDTDPPIFAVNSIIVRADTTQATNGYHDLLGRMWNFGVRVQID